MTVATAGALALISAKANADCSIIETLRSAARLHFRAVAGEPSRIDDEAKSTLDVKGGKCKISWDNINASATHECTFVLTKDPTVAKTVYSQFVADVALCVASKEAPSRRVSNRSEQAVFEDLPDTLVTVYYYFESGYYLLDLDYFTSRSLGQ